MHVIIFNGKLLFLWSRFHVYVSFRWGYCGNNSSSHTFAIMRHQIQDAKDLHHLSLVGSYGAHLLHGFPPHFLHPTVTSAGSVNNPFSSSGGAFVKPFPSNLPMPSAFAPPSKCLGLEQVKKNSTYNLQQFCFLLMQTAFHVLDVRICN